MIFRHAVGFLVILAVSVPAARGQSRSAPRIAYSIAGTVHDDTTQGSMDNIRVDLKQSTGIPVNSTFTNGSGNFEFAGLSGGNYTIEIEAKGYEPVRQNVEVRNQSQSLINISMSRSAVVMNPASAGTISAHQLSVPHKAYDEYEKGMELLYGKLDYRGAVAQFERAIKDFATYYEAYANMGNAYMRLHEMAPAEQALRKSVELSAGRYSEGLLMLAGLLNGENQYQDASTFARKAIALESSSWRGYFELSRALSGLNQDDEAEKSAVLARDLNPTNPPVYLILANIHIHRRDRSSLLKDLDSYLNLQPVGPEASQARKMRDDLLSSEEQTDQSSDAESDQDSDTADSTSPRRTKQPSGLPPDMSGLPSLPPPAESNP